MDGGDHVEIEERSELQSLSKEDLIERVLKLNMEKKELMMELETSAVTEQETGLNNASEPTNKKSSVSENLAPKSCDVEMKKPKKQKPFDFTRYHKRHIALKMAYLGWNYHGFVSQESTENTIEGHFFAALSKACLIQNRSDCNYSRCGRTDKGVSAFAQVVSLDVRSNLAEGLGIVISGDPKKVQERVGKAKGVEEIPYVHVLNKLLPPEIRVIAWTPVDQDFDARFSCFHRTYKYFFPAANVNIDAMSCAAQKFVGQHDFRNFCKMDVASGVVTFERNLLSFTVGKVNSDLQNHDGYDMCEMTICGSAFLWHQVRCMVAVLLMIGQNLENVEVIDWMLDINKCPRRPQYNMASETPLVLYDCVYEKLSWRHEPGIYDALMKDFQAQWTTHAVKATMLTKLIDKLDNPPMIKDISDSNEVQLSDSEKCDRELAWCDMRQPQFHQLISLVPFQVVSKAHKPLMKRAMHKSLESKLETVNAKRRKAGKEEFSEKPSNAKPRE